MAKYEYHAETVEHWSDSAVASLWRDEGLAAILV
jgi:hypothetical protein